MPIWARTSIAGVVFLASVILAGHLSLQQAHAPTTSADRGTECGSKLEVALTGSGYIGGEPRGDQDAFDAACASKARHDMIPVIPLGLVSLVALGYVVNRLRISEREATRRWDQKYSSKLNDEVD